MKCNAYIRAFCATIEDKSVLYT